MISSMESLKMHREKYNKSLKYLLCFTLLLLIFNVIYLQNSSVLSFFRFTSTSSIYSNDSQFKLYSFNEISFSNILFFPEDINKSELNIFFIESTCCTKKSKGLFDYVHSNYKYVGILLNTRQVCAIESTANLNRNYMINILYTCPINEENFKSTPNEIIELFRYPNVRIIKIDMNEYFKNTPVEDLFVKGTLEKSRYPLEHASDVLRFITLWKYGGTYLDLDIINLKRLMYLGSNFAGYELKDAIGSAVLNFENKGIGFELLTQILKHLNQFFDANEWSNNGPHLLTITLFKLCRDTKVIKEKYRQICNGFTLYESMYFYPIPWDGWKLYFEEIHRVTTMELIKNSYIVHLWNRHSKDTKVVIGSKQPYELLAEKYCPLTHLVIKVNKSLSPVTHNLVDYW